MLYLAYKADWDSSLMSMTFSWDVLHERLFYNQRPLPQMLQCMLNLSLNVFHQDQSLRGLCALSDSNHQSLNPFLVARDFSVRCLGVNENQFILNVSPIYHLNHDYPEMYQQQFGKTFDPSAIVGLIEMTDDQGTGDGPLFRYGIDLGVAFKERSAVYNRTITLSLSSDEHKVDAILTCGDNVSMKIIPLDDLALAIKEKYVA